MASGLFFEEDEVSVLTDNDELRFGLVTESSECFSSGDEGEEDGEETAAGERLRKGTVRVSWHPDGQSQVVTEAELRLVDRALIPGDIVRRFIQGEDSQRGCTIMTNIKCHLQVIGKPVVICDINSRDLLPISPFNAQPGYVYLDSWVGKVVNVLERVTLRFGDGARCEVMDEETINLLLDFTDLNDPQSKDSSFSSMVFYKGQLLKGDLGSFQDVKWLRKTNLHNPRATKRWPNRHVTITVEKVETYQLEVNWICHGFSNQGSESSNLEPPSRIINDETLQRVKNLDCFEACNYKVGERALYILKDSDEVVTVNPKDCHSSIHQVMKAKAERAGRNDLTTSTSGLEVLKSKSANNIQQSSSNVERLTSSELLSKDEFKKESLEKCSIDCTTIPEANSSTVSLNAQLISSQSKLSNEKKQKNKLKKPALPVYQTKSKKLKPAKSKTLAHSSNLASVKIGDKYPVEIIYTSTTVDVIWQDGSKELGIKSTELFPVHHLDVLEFFPGDYVVSSTEIQAPGVYGVIQSVDHWARICKVKWFQHNSTSSVDTVLKEDEVSVYDIKDHPDLKFQMGHVVVRVNSVDAVEQTSSGNEKQLAVGQVYELNSDGPLTIQWHDGSKSQVSPLQLYIIGDEMSDLFSDSEEASSSEDESSDEGSLEWETEEETQLPLENDSSETNNVESIASENSNALDGSFVDHLKETVNKFEEIILPLESKGQAAACGKFSKCLLKVFHLCTDFDDAFGTTFFSSKELATAMVEMKRQCKKSRASRLNRQEANIRNVASELQDSHVVLTPLMDESGNDSGLEKSPSASELREMETDVSELSDEGTVSAAAAVTSLVCSEIALKVMKFNKLLNNGDAVVLSNGELQSDGIAENAELKAEFKESCIVDVAAVLDKLGELLKRTQNMWQNSESEEKQLCFNALKLLCDAIASNPEHLMVTVVQSLCSKVNQQSSEESVSSASTADAASGTQYSDGTQDSVSKSEDLQENSVVANSIEKHRGHDLTLSSMPSESFSDESDVASKTPLTPAEIRAKIEFNPEGFTLLDSLPEFHHYKDQNHVPVDRKKFNSTIRTEMKLLKSCLPNGIYVKGFESRMDLYSVMIEGPSRTPYEDGLFFFDVQLPDNYPSSPPLFFYISYCSDRLNPNLYEDGKVCVSLLGTWTGKGTEVWSSKSNLLQVLISIQGLILNSEPYYNEAGYERQKGTQVGHENSRMYNEMAIVKMVQSMTKIATNSYQPFSNEIQNYLSCRAYRLVNRLRLWINLTDNGSTGFNLASAKSASSAANETSLNLQSTGKSKREKSDSAMVASSDTPDLPIEPPPSDFAVTSNESETLQKSRCSELSGLSSARLSKSDTSEGSVEALSRYKSCDETSLTPAFPLLPASKGFKLSLSSCLDNFEAVLQSVGISKH